MTTQEILDCMSCQFVPQQLDKIDDDTKIRWKVTLTIGRQSFTTDYWQGLGHLPKSIKCQLTPNYLRWGNRSLHDERIILTYLAGTRYDFAGSINREQPDKRDILYCLIRDADVLNYANFEQWASEFGYDSDSRKAESIYQACLKTALQLRGMLGDEVMQRLQTEFQDY